MDENTRLRGSAGNRSGWGRLTPILWAVIALSLVCTLCLPAPAQAYSSQELAFLELINQYRQQNGLDTLMLSGTISEACRRHNSDMGTYAFFSHYTVTSDHFAAGATPWDRMAASGYDYNTSKAENIAAGFSTAQAVFDGWKGVPGHNANMLDVDFKVIGISMLSVPGSAYGTYWTTDFGGYIDPSAVASAPPKGDKQPPSVSIASPSSGSTVKGSLTIDVTSNDDVGVSRVELTINDAIRATDADFPHQFIWDSTKSPDGPYVIRATAYDASGNSSTAAITVTLGNHATGSGDTTAQAATYFLDVPRSHPYYPAVEAMRKAGIIEGYQSGSDWVFGLEQAVNRAQFTKMLCGVMGIEVNEELCCPFTDLGANDTATYYPHDYVTAAANAGITRGVTAQLFAPWDGVSRAQVITMVVRAAQALKPGVLDTPPAGFCLSIPSSGVPTHDANLEIAEYNGMLAGLRDRGSDWDPWANATRGEVAAMLWVLMSL